MEVLSKLALKKSVEYNNGMIPNILIIEDDKDLQNYLKEMLSDGKYTDEDIENYFITILNAKEEKHSEVEELIQLNNNNMLSIGG